MATMTATACCNLINTDSAQGCLPCKGVHSVALPDFMPAALKLVSYS